MEVCRRAIESRWVTGALIAIIMGNAILLGIEAGPSAVEHASWFRIVHVVVTVVFWIELVARVVAHAGRMRELARDGWTWFDAIVIVGSTIPAVGAWAQIARLLRVLRVLRLVSVAPQLRLMVSTMIRSVPSLGSIGLLLSLILYVYAVIGVQFFSAADPAHWGSLGRAFLTLFQVLTLEGWVELQRAAMVVTPWAWVFFGSFVVIAVFVIVNLFIAVVLSNLERARAEDASAQDGTEGTTPAAAGASGDATAAQLAALVAEVAALRALLEHGPPPPAPSAATARESEPQRPDPPQRPDQQQPPSAARSA